MVNVYIISFKSDLWLFIEQKVEEIKDFDDKLEIVEDKDSITLIDAINNKIILNDVYYVSDNQDWIFFMMRFRQEHKANFKFTDSEIFTIIIINQIFSEF